MIENKLLEAKNNLKVKSSIKIESELLVDNFDPKILDFIIVLNALGFSTYSSCQGHPENYNYMPFVLFCNSYSERLPDYSKLASSTNAKKPTKSLIDNLKENYLETLSEQARITKYLNEFYEDRNTVIQNKLVIQSIAYLRFSIEPYNSMLDKPETLEEKVELNNIALNEIYDFTEFLKSKL